MKNEKKMRIDINYNYVTINTKYTESKYYIIRNKNFEGAPLYFDKYEEYSKFNKIKSINIFMNDVGFDCFFNNLSYLENFENFDYDYRNENSVEWDLDNYNKYYSNYEYNTTFYNKLKKESRLDDCLFKYKVKFSKKDINKRLGDVMWDMLFGFENFPNIENLYISFDIDFK